ncbi:Predicted chitinase [Raoultella terrigena]|uniref:Predicted chitinase n=1 Tax=Raoultella terrigena TaxID=577 RepID=A0A3P8M0E7_RAOTE|nr:Predicted chitinase [Raoultella terrigena]
MVEAGLTFSELEENLRYTTLSQLKKIFGRHFKDDQEAEQFLRQPMKLANRVYANRLGNGDEASGDGYRYRGRGLIQLTGKSEYQEFAKFINMSVEEAAEWCNTPEGAAVSGCWYLKTRNCFAPRRQLGFGGANRASQRQSQSEPRRSYRFLKSDAESPFVSGLRQG